MLQVKPKMRPSCEQLIQMPMLMKKAKYFFPQMVHNYTSLDQSILLKTIKVPMSLMTSEESHFWNDLSQKLPKPAYIASQTEQSMCEDIYDLASHRSLLHLKNDSISRINLPQIHSLKSIKAKENSPSLKGSKKRNLHKKSFELQHSLLKNQSMDMYGIAEHSDDENRVDRDLFQDVTTHHKVAKPLKRPVLREVSAGGLSLVDISPSNSNVYAFQQDIHKKILLGRPIKHAKMKGLSKGGLIAGGKKQAGEDSTVTSQSTKRQAPQPSLMYEDYVKSFKLPTSNSSALTPIIQQEHR